jgi:hypothetical protein
MICESFSVNITEFEQIFGTFPNQNEFYLWDTDANGLIDSFELFCGLILYAECSTEEKIKCLFDLFDFNHIQSIAFYDLCYMIECCISSSFKMHKVGSSIPSQKLEIYISTYFFQAERTNLNNIIRFVINSPEVKKFFQIFRLDPILNKNKNKFTYVEFKIQKDLYNEYKNKYLQIENLLEGEQNGNSTTFTLSTLSWHIERSNFLRVKGWNTS